MGPWLAESWRSLMMMFGVRYVVLVDFDGDTFIKRIEFRNGRAFARRHNYDIANVFLLDNGALTGAAYVKRWEPYQPFAARTWPKWEKAT